LTRLVAGRIEPDERWLAEAHVDSCALCRRLLAQLAQLSLVAGAEASGEALTPPAEAPVLRPELIPGTRCGRYLVLRVLGVGAMGAVVAAYDPELDRKVAIKVLHGGGAPRYEAQALARLHHPNVVSVFEIGGEAGREHIVMEFVEGQTASAWLNERDRAWRDVVRLFIAAGRGLAAVHDAGLVHRDFKPSNILVGRDGWVRLGDLGLASSTLAEPGAIAGTPAYMSPEQWRGAGVDPRSDQFSFCVALFEGITGRHPFGGTTAASTGAAVWPRAPRLPAWLRAVIDRGLMPTPAARYPSMHALVDALVDDGRRRRTTTVRTLAAVIAVGLAALGWRTTRQAEAVPPCSGAAADVAAVWGPERGARLAAAFAATGRAHATTTASLVANRVDRWTETWRTSATAACRATRVTGEQSEVLLDQRMVCYRRALAGTDEALRVLGDAPSPELVDRAVDVVAGLPSPAACSAVDQAGIHPPPGPGPLRDRLEVMERELVRAAALERAGQYRPALEQVNRLRAEAHEVGYPPFEARLLLLTGEIVARGDGAADAEATLGDALRAAARAADDATAAEVWTRLIFLIGCVLDRRADAIARLSFAELAVLRAGDPPLLRAGLEDTLAELQLAQHHGAEAAVHFQRVLELRTRALPPDDRLIADAVGGLCVARYFQGATEAALPHCRRSLAALEAAVGREHPAVAGALVALSAALREHGDLDEALTAARRSVEIRRATYGDGHPAVAYALQSLAAAQVRAKDHVHGCATFAEVLAVSTRSFGGDDPRTAQAMSQHAACMKELGDPGIAVVELEHALAVQRRGDVHDDLALTLAELGDLARRAGDLARARSRLTEAIAEYEASLGSGHPLLAAPLGYLGDCELAAGRADRAARAFERALALHDLEPHDAARLRFGLARSLWHTDTARAISLARQARTVYEHAPPGFARDLAAVSAWLAGRERAAARGPHTGR